MNTSRTLYQLNVNNILFTLENVFFFLNMSPVVYMARVVDGK